MLEAWAGSEVVEIVRHLIEWSALGIEVLEVTVIVVAVIQCASVMSIHSCSLSAPILLEEAKAASVELLAFPRDRAWSSDAGKYILGSLERFEPQHRRRDALHASVILIHNIRRASGRPTAD